MLNTLIDLILPPRCGSCQKIVLENMSLCGDCFQKAHFITPPFCSLCGLPFEYETEGQTICLNCAKDRPLFDRARFALPYDDFSKPMILAFKHGDRCDLAPLFAKWMYASAHDLFEGCDLIVPVPLHWRRLFHRKYNQSSLIAENLSKISGVACEQNFIKRVKNTPSLGHLSANQRQKNLQGAFICHEDLSGKTVLIVDDVFTTGTTINQCTRILKKARAREIRVLTLARVLKEQTRKNFMPL